MSNKNQKSLDNHANQLNPNNNSTNLPSKNQGQKSGKGRDNQPPKNK